MKINIKCPVCNATNQLAADKNNCRRCDEDLSLLYRIKGYSFTYRIYLAQLLLQGRQDNLQQKKNLAGRAVWLVKK